MTTGDMQSTTTESQPFSIRQDLTNISSSSITNSDIHNDELRLEITSTAGTYSSSKDSTNASCRPISNQSFASELELQSTSTQQPQAISVTAKDISALATTSSSQAIVRCATGSWIKNFKIPARWEPSIEKALSDGKLTPEQKSALNRQLCMSIIAQSTDTVTASERNQIALMLVQKYPCLSGSIGSGHQFWANKIKDRLLNITRKSSRENKKMIESTGQQYQKAKPGRKRKSDEALNLPEMPEGETDETIQEHLTSLQAFCKTGKQDVLLVRQLMDVTFPKRRRDIIENNERVWKVVKDYPPLTKGKGNEVKAELGRILRNKNLPQEMKERFDINRARLIAAVKRSKTKEVQALAILLDESDSSQITEMENRMLMAALPFALGEKRTSTLSPGDLFWKRVDDETGDMSISQLVEESTTPRLLSSGTALEVSSLCLAAEGMVNETLTSFLNRIFTEQCRNINRNHILNIKAQLVPAAMKYCFVLFVVFMGAAVHGMPGPNDDCISGQSFTNRLCHLEKWPMSPGPWLFLQDTRNTISWLLSNKLKEAIREFSFILPKVACNAFK
ncbi:Hypothetical predicted protein [Paramuricea clavata]|uniref:Uncharacterized protein n=1 Tax=Paramuricea clavata TaxID=317549 RepID=A0A6S7H614_PARCT|nr:Hypothetical predicted protein [Paramuricea clavata]